MCEIGFVTPGRLHDKLACSTYRKYLTSFRRIIHQQLSPLTIRMRSHRSDLNANEMKALSARKSRGSDVCLEGSMMFRLQRLLA